MSLAFTLAEMSGTRTDASCARSPDRGEGRAFSCSRKNVDLDRRGRRVNSKPGSDATTAFIDVCRWRYTAASLVVHGGVVDQRALRMRTCVGDGELRANEQKQSSWEDFNWKFTITLGF